MWLRQSTASQEILLGRFVDSTDGNTEETALTIANTDIKLWVEGATTLASKNSGGATHIANGLYSAVLDATDTATLGKLEVHVHVTGALAVKREFMVLPANVYDALVLGTDALQVDAIQLNGTAQTARDIGASVLISSGTGTGQLSVTSGVIAANVTQFGGTNGTFSGGRPEVNTSHWGGTAVASANVRANLTQILGTAVDSSQAQLGVNVVWMAGDGTGPTGLAAMGGDYTNVGYVTANLGAILGTAPTEGAAGRLAGAFTTLFDVASPVLTAASVNQTGDSYARIGATGSGLTSLAPAATALSTAQWTNTRAGNLDNLDATVSSRLATAGYTTPPTVTAIADQVWDEVLSGHLTAGTTGAALNGASAPSAATVAAAVWDLSTTGHTTSGTFGAAMSAAGSAGDPWETSLPGAYGAGTAGYIVGTNLDATVSSRSTYAGADTSGTTTLLSRVGTPVNLNGGGATLTGMIADVFSPATNAEGLAGSILATLGTPVTDLAADIAALPTATTIWANATRTLTANPGLDAAGVRSAVGLASANLDTQLSTIAGYIDTEVGAIKTRVELALPSAAPGGSNGLLILGANSGGLTIDNPDGSAVTLTASGAFGSGLTVNGSSNGDAVAIIAGSVGSGLKVSGNVGMSVIGTGSYGLLLRSQAPINPVDLALSNSSAPTLRDAILTAGAITSTVAPNLDVAVSTLATAASITTLTGYVDTEVAAIKAKTDQLTFTATGQVDANTRSVNDVRLTGTGVLNDEWGPA